MVVPIYKDGRPMSTDFNADMRCTMFCAELDDDGDYKSKVRLSGTYTTWFNNQGKYYFNVKSELYLGPLWQDIISITQTLSFSSRNRFTVWQK